MKKQELLSKSAAELLDILNKDYSTNGEEIVDQFSPTDEVDYYDNLCSECYHQTEQKSSGDEGVTYCENCQLTEGQTLEVSIIKPLKLAYVWTNQVWISADEDMGSES